jgi:haloalkane dehalogenase
MIKGLTNCETVVINHSSYDDYGPIGGLLKKVRGPEGVHLALGENFFMEKVFVRGVMRDIDEETMTEIRRPYKNKGEDRRTTLSWARQIPIEGKPENVAVLFEANSKWMVSHEIPKLFIDVKPGQIVFQVDLDIIRSWPNLAEVTVKGLHHPQEDSPDDIGRGLRDWYKKIG